MEFLTALKKPIIFWQYKDSNKFAKLLNLYIDLLMKMYPYEWWEFLDLDVAEGYALDIIGQRLGLPRPKDDPSTAGIYDVAEYESCYYDYSSRDIDLVKDDTYRYMLKLRIMMYQPWRASSVKSLYDALEFAYPGKEFKIIRTPSYFTRIGPVDYTTIGSPIIEDGIVSDFSSSNLLETDSTVAPQNITERVCKLKFNSSAFGTERYHNVFYGPASMSLVFYAGSGNTFAVSCYLPNTSSSLYKGALQLIADTWYWFKYTYNGTTASLYKSTDGINYELLDSVTATISGSVANCKIGNRWNGDDSYFDGAIDLNDTYIKVNNATWFGKTQERSKDIIELHALSYMNYPERRALFSNVVVAPMATTLLKYYDYNNI